MSRKAQSFMPDFMASLLVFSVVISIFLFSWSTVQTNQDDAGPEQEMREDAHYTTTFLVSTPGYPEDWDNTTVEIPGFASGSDNVLSGEKLREFRKVSYEDQKKLLDGHNFSLEFWKNDTHKLELNSKPLSYGEAPSDASLVVPVKRNVLVEKPGGLEDAEMRYIVWR